MIADNMKDSKLHVIGISDSYSYMKFEMQYGSYSLY